MAAKNYKLMVSGLGGKVFIGKTTKTPHVMLSDRVVVPEEEFINAVLAWAIAKIKKGKKGDNVLVITGENDERCFKIIIEDKKFLEK
jgi:hypothetical protein